MKTLRGIGWSGSNWTAGCILALLALLPAVGFAGGLPLPEPRGSDPTEGSLYAAIRMPGERFGLAGSGETRILRLEADDASGPGGSKAPPTPFLAGFLSLLVPGTGHLLQGNRRGWFYLGAEAASWFAYFGLHGAGSQAEEDYKEFADAGWDSSRYVNTPVCFDGLGPTRFEEESAALWEARQNSPDQYYQDLADRDAYACGWDSLTLRNEYRSMIQDADRLYSAAQWTVGAMVLNRVVSSIDAARSAAGKRKTWLQSLRVAPEPDGLRAELTRSF